MTKLTNNKNRNILDNLPRGFIVKLVPTSSGTYLAEIPELDTFTEVRTLDQLEFAINDLVVTYFDIPTKYYKNIWYMPTSKAATINSKISPQKTYKYALFTKSATLQAINC